MWADQEAMPDQREKCSELLKDLGTEGRRCNFQAADYDSNLNFGTRKDV
jgi:hypothetical protein